MIEVNKIINGLSAVQFDSFFELDGAWTPILEPEDIH